MHKSLGLLLSLGVAACSWVEGSFVNESALRDVDPSSLLKAFSVAATHASPNDLVIRFPLKNSLFPQDIRATEFIWTDATPANLWVVDFRLPTERVRVLVDKKSWTPDRILWDRMKSACVKKTCEVTINGARWNAEGTEKLSSASTSYSVSEDRLDAPLVYREAPIPIRRFNSEGASYLKSVSLSIVDLSQNQQPRVLMEGVNACWSCHSFSDNGKRIAMELKQSPERRKQVFAIFDIKDGEAKADPANLVDLYQSLTPAQLARYDKLISKTNIRHFFQWAMLSPDGNYIITSFGISHITLQQEPMPEDSGIYTEKYSYLQYPTQGDIAFFSLAKKEFGTLPGADDFQHYIYYNPRISPDMKTVIFSRMDRVPFPELKELYDPEVTKWVGVDNLEEARKKVDATFLKTPHDLFTVPFNGGKGGVATPLPGASKNGYHNFFPRYTPDGKWIVFIMSPGPAYIQPDSQLYILSAQGGEARKMACNFPAGDMNSWHSFTPNGKWMVFESKTNGRVTEFYITHLDDQGRDTPAVRLNGLINKKDMAGSAPEFFNGHYDDLQKIDVPEGGFVDVPG